MLLNWKPRVCSPSLPSFSKPRPAVPVKAKGENPHNPNQHGEVRIIGEEGGGKQVAALYKQTVVNNLSHGLGWPQEGRPAFLFLRITPPAFDTTILITFQKRALRNF